MLPLLLGAASLSIWLGLAFARGGFWRTGQPNRAATARERSVIAVIPARNEAETIGTAVTSLLAQEFSPPLKIVVVDDQSTDRTAEIAQAAAREAGRAADLTIIHGEPLPSGWTGKVWAMAQGAARAEQFHADFLLLTDADIRHGSSSLADLAAIAESRGCDLTSFMVKLVCRTPAERLLIPAFVFFFFKLYPPAWTASDRFRTAGAAGGCMLIRSEVLRQIGGFASIRGAVIDDCALARAVKQSRGRLWLGLTEEAESIRPYGSFAEIGRMISRTAFYQLRHSPLLLAATIAGLGLTYVAPPLLALRGNRFGAAAWLVQIGTYLPMVRFYRLSPLWALSLPAAACFYMGATLHSAVSYWRGRGGAWKGRIQDTGGTDDRFLSSVNQESTHAPDTFLQRYSRESVHLD